MRTRYKYNLREEAKKIGKSKDYFYASKKSNPKSFELWQNLGNGSLAEGYLKAESKFFDYKYKISEIYFYLHEKTEMSKFYHTFNNELSLLYVNSSSFIQGLNTMAFAPAYRFNYSLFKKMEKIIELFKKYTEEQK